MSRSEQIKKLKEAGLLDVSDYNEMSERLKEIEVNQEQEVKASNKITLYNIKKLNFI